MSAAESRIVTVFKLIIAFHLLGELKKRASICAKIKVSKQKNNIKELFMSILNTLALESNKQIKINFNGGDLSSDAGLILIKEFAAKLGLISLIRKYFKTTDTAAMRRHTDDKNLMQMIYQIIAAYFEDDCADELKADPVFKALLNADALDFLFQSQQFELFPPIHIYLEIYIYESFLNVQNQMSLLSDGPEVE